MSVHVNVHLEANIRERAGSRWWHCPGCGRTLGEICGDRLVIIRGPIHLSQPIQAGLAQVCHHCHTESCYPVMLSS